MKTKFTPARVALFAVLCLPIAVIVQAVLLTAFIDPLNCCSPNVYKIETFPFFIGYLVVLFGMIVPVAAFLMLMYVVRPDVRNAFHYPFALPVLLLFLAAPFIAEAHPQYGAWIFVAVDAAAVLWTCCYGWLIRPLSESASIPEIRKAAGSTE